MSKSTKSGSFEPKKGRKKQGGPRHGRSGGGPRGRGGSDAASEIIHIWGIHAVAAALNNPLRQVDELLLTENAAARIAEAVTPPLPPAQQTSPKELSRRLGEEPVHQGALLVTRPLPSPALEEIDPAARLVILDQVTDPHNVGAILRSAAAFGIDGLVMTQRNSPPLGGVLAKTASGGLEHVPVTFVSNLAQALTTLGKAGFERIGFDGAGSCLMTEIEGRPGQGLALIFGAEEKGLRRLTMEHCDQVCRIHAAGAFASLNVSNAAAIAFHHFQMKN